MAGYIMNLNSMESLVKRIETGVYSTLIKQPNGHWGINHEGTFADYATMQEGDNIYFFISRKIYGIGTLVGLEGECKFKNYPHANNPQPHRYEDIRGQLLHDFGEQSPCQRWICTFKPNPFFLKCGVDMDEILSSNPLKFKMLRAFWRLSFIKIDDDENQALIDVLLKVNEESLHNPIEDACFGTNYQKYHQDILRRMSVNHTFTAKEILSASASKDKISHEMAIEAGLLYQLSTGHANTVQVFGRTDYLSHQVIASPFKPIDYMDKMDVFGYSYILGYRTKSKFLVAELKKDSASIEDVDQVMKYVDWVKEEYSYGDYSMIRAFLVAHDFTEQVINYANEAGLRKFTIGKRPALTKEWRDLTLVRYRFEESIQQLVFFVV